MANNSVEEKIKVNNFFDLLKAPVNSWVEINGNDEFRVPYHSLRSAVTLCMEDNYICKKRYNIFLGSLTPTYIEKFLKGTGGDMNIIKFGKMIEQGDNN
jgi:hypothetical protein